MYVTRPLSEYIKFPASLSSPPPEGPNSGYLVIQDEESETTTCFGLCVDREIRDLPLPQNKLLTVRYSSSANNQTDVYSHVSRDDVFFIPVLNQPLSSNKYYAIKAHGKHTGKAYTSSKEEDMGTCCFCKYVRDIKPKPLDPQDAYQQFEIFIRGQTCSHWGGFLAKTVAPDGFPPYFLRRRGWEIHTSTPKNYALGEARGLDTALRIRLPEFNFSLSCKSSETVVVGKWYCPFMFIKEATLRDQMKRSMFYEITLEQKWKQIFACDNSDSKSNAVAVDVVVQAEVVLVGEKEALHDEKDVLDGVMWFKSFGSEGGDVSVGLSSAVVERMKWEQVRFGWDGEKERQVRVNRVEEFGGMGGWGEFGCYVLAERFVLKRMDGSLVLTYEFNHTHQIRSKWE